MNRNAFRAKRTAAAVALLLGASRALAVEFEVGDGWQGNWNTTIALGTNWRAEHQDKGLFTAANGALRGFSGGLGDTNNDSGNLNYDKGDVWSQVLKFTTEVSLAKNGTGGLVRVKGWYDHALIHNDVRFGSQGQRPYYTPNQPLSDDGLLRENRFKGIKLMDAYGYTSFDLGTLPAQVRLGNQVVNWGESVFLQGINQVSPIDVPALRRGAGTELKEFLVPVPLLHGNLGLPGGMSLEAFYQLKWERTVVDACGTYFAPAENSVAYRTGKCDIATTFGAGSSAESLAEGQFVRLIDGPKARNNGQFGVALRVPVERLDTEVGIYYQQLHSRAPFISLKTGEQIPPAAGLPFLFTFGAFGDPNSTSAGFYEYPEKTKTLGVSASTTIGGWSTALEASYSTDVPAQINGADILAAYLFGVGPLGPTALATAPRTVFHGYDLFKKAQLQANAVKVFSNVLGAQSLSVVGEIGFQKNNVPDFRNGGRRYGRALIYGVGAYPGLAEAGIENSHPDGIHNDGYITDFAYGVRLRGALTYNDVFGSGLTATPSLFYARDIKGVSIDGQFNEGRQTVALGLKLDYQKKFAVDLGYVTYANSAKWDLFRDRDYYSLTVSASF